jgi:hypothetical protein
MKARLAHFLGLARQGKRRALPNAETAPAAPATAEPEQTGWEAEKRRQLAMATEPHTAEPDIGEDSDDDPAEMIGGPNAAARQRERERIRSIMQSRSGLANPALALSIACRSELTRHEAIAFLDRRAGAAAW